MSLIKVFVMVEPWGQPRRAVSVLGLYGLPAAFVLLERLMSIITLKSISLYNEMPLSLPISITRPRS